ncbi:MAG: MFS transporter [Candidatus Helarchaeota archaeon]
MSLLDKLEIQMEKKIFAFLIVFFIIFLGIDIVSIAIIQINTFVVVYYYLVPLIIVLIVAGSLVDRARRSWFLVLLVGEGFLTIALAFNITTEYAMDILFVFIGIFSGFTLVAILGFFADMTTIEHRGKVGGIVTAIGWVIAAIVLSWISSTIFAADILMFAFGGIKIAGGAIAIYLLFTKVEESTSSSSIEQTEGRGFLSIIQESFDFVYSDPKFSAYLVAFILIFLSQGLFLPIGGAGQSPFTQTYQQIASIGFAAGGLFLFLTGFLLDKSRKQVLIYGAILTTISFLSYYFPIGATFLAGLPILITTILIVIGDIASPSRRARYYSVFLSITLFAYLIGLLVGSFLTSSPWIALICGIFTGIALLFIYIWGEESNIEEITFPTTPPSSESKPSDTPTEPATPPSVAEPSESSDL